MHTGREMDIREAIRSSYLARDFTDEQLESLYKIAVCRSFEDGEEILRQFDNTRDVLILASGSANILTVVGEPIGMVTPGMPMGEISFIDSKSRSGTAVANGHCEVVVLPAEPLMAILQASPPMAVKALWNLSKVLCMRLRAANNNLAALMAIEESEVGVSKR